jgi:hypothetical protein
MKKADVKKEELLKNNWVLWPHVILPTRMRPERPRLFENRIGPIGDEMGYEIHILIYSYS